VDRPEARSVTGSHILVEAVDSIGSGKLTVLLVHVVGSGARVVSDPDTEVLDLLGALLEDLELN
jgi:microcompartment protein CcmK/EutM